MTAKRINYIDPAKDYVHDAKMLDTIRKALQTFPVELLQEIFEVAQVTIEEKIVNEVTGRPAKVETIIKERSLFTPIRMTVRAKVLYGGQSRKALCILNGDDDTLYKCTITFRHIGGKQMVELSHDFSGMEQFASKLQQNHQTPIYITTTNPAGHFTCYTRQVDVQVQWTPNVRAIVAHLDQRATVRGCS